MTDVICFSFSANIVGVVSRKRSVVIKVGYYTDDFGAVDDGGSLIRCIRCIVNSFWGVAVGTAAKDISVDFESLVDLFDIFDVCGDRRDYKVEAEVLERVFLLFVEFSLCVGECFPGS